MSSLSATRRAPIGRTTHQTWLFSINCAPVCKFARGIPSSSFDSCISHIGHTPSYPSPHRYRCHMDIPHLLFYSCFPHRFVLIFDVALNVRLGRHRLCIWAPRVGLCLSKLYSLQLVCRLCVCRLAQVSQAWYAPIEAVMCAGAP